MSLSFPVVGLLPRLSDDEVASLSSDSEVLWVLDAMRRLRAWVSLAIPCCSYRVLTSHSVADMVGTVFQLMQTYA